MRHDPRRAQVGIRAHTRGPGANRDGAVDVLVRRREEGLQVFGVRADASCHQRVDVLCSCVEPDLTEK